MLTQTYQHLRTQTIAAIVQAEGDSEHLLLQIHQLQKGKKGRISCLLSDGHLSAKAIFVGEKPISLDNQFSLICLKKHTVSESSKRVGIIDFDIVCSYAELIGQPIDVEATHSPPLSPFIAIQQTKIKSPISDAYKRTERKIQQKSEQKSEYKSEQKTEQKTASKLEAYSSKKEPKRENDFKLPPPRPLEDKASDYETIQGLWLGIKNWHLLCRIVKIEYEEFKKRDSDKTVEVLNVDLMDRSNVKISGAFFYEAAQKFRHALKLNSVYKISQGNIQNESYSNSKNDRISPFRLLFNTNSQFEQVSDVKIIASPEDAAITMGDLVESRNMTQEYDVVGILVDIGEPVELAKADKMLHRCFWIIADPLKEITMHAVIWNDKIKEDRALIGRTVILSRFVLKDYNGSLTLSSKMRSSIQLAAQHAFQQQEATVMQTYKTYQNISERRNEPLQTTPACRSIKQLSARVQRMEQGDTIRSDLHIWVNKMVMKKWFFQGCPHCQRVAQDRTSCANCHKYVEQTVPHFIIGTEIADSCGSLWTTAYDEFAKKIFDEDDVINKLKKYDPMELKDIVENYYYQEYKLRLYTKKDNEGRIKHNVGKVHSEKTVQKILLENMERIKQLLVQ